MSAGAISAGSVFVSIKADLMPFTTAMGTLEKRIRGMNKTMNTSIDFPGQAGRVTIASEAATTAVGTLAGRFDSLAVSIAGANTQLSMMVKGMQKAGIKFTRMGNAVAAVRNSSAELAAANPVPKSWASNIGAFNSRLQSTVQATRYATNAMLGLSAVILGPIALSVRTFMGFEKQMQRVGILTNANAATFAKLEKAALHLGATTQFSSTQAAEGMRELAMGGQSAAEILQSIPAVLNLAAVGDMGMGDAAKVIIRVSNSFGLLAEDANFVADVIAKTATSSSTSVKEIAGAFRYVAGTANLMNQSIEETGALLAVLADKGVPATMAGRTLNSAMLEFVKKKDKIKETLGVMLVDPKTQQVRAFGDVLQDLRKSLEGMPPAEKTAKIFDIFGKIGGRAAIAIMESGDALDDMRKSVKDNVGFAAAFVEKMMDSLFGSFEKMRSALTNLGSALGKALAPAIGKLFNDITRWANELEKQPGLLKEWGEYALDLGKKILIVAFGLKALGMALSVALLGFKLFGGASAIWDKHGAAIGAFSGKVSELVVKLSVQLYAAMVKLAIQGKALAAVYAGVAEKVTEVATSGKNRGPGLRPSKPQNWIPPTVIPFSFADPKITFFEKVKKVLISLKKYAFDFATTLVGIVSGAVKVGFAVLAVKILAVASAFAALLLVAYKLWNFFGDKEAIEEAKKNIDELRALMEKTVAEAKTMPEGKGDTSEVIALKNMVRRGKTQEEIQKRYSESVRDATKAIERQKAALRFAKGMGSVQSMDVAEGHLAMLEDRLKALVKLKGTLTSTAIFDPMALEGEAEAWEEMFSRMKAARAQFMENELEKEEQKKHKKLMESLDSLVDIDPQSGMAAILRAKAAYEFQAQELLNSINEREEKARKAEQYGQQGLSALYGDDEGKKAFTDGLNKDWANLAKLRGLVDELGDSYGTAAKKTTSFRQSVEDSMRALQAERAKTKEERAFGKMEPEAAKKYVQSNLDRIKAAGLYAEREVERLSALAKLNPTYKGQAEEAAKVLLDTQRELYKWEDRREGLKEKDVGKELEAKSIGFWGSQNPLEMLGGGQVKVDQKLLAESIKQTGSLASIDGKLSKLHGNFY